jgi:glycosyltransferase involved in cell wall biosynthesis
LWVVRLFDIIKFLQVEKKIFNLKIQEIESRRINKILIPEPVQNSMAMRSLSKIGVETKKVLICHDVIIFTNPEWFTNVAISRIPLVKKNFEIADEIVCVSAETKNQLESLEHLRKFTQNKKISINPLGSTCSNWWQNENYLQSTPLKILYVSAIQPRKNHLNLIKALEIAAKFAPIELHLVAGDSWGNLALSNLSLYNSELRIFIHNKLDEGSLLELYKSVDLSCYLSFKEGFGLPVLESLKNGTPVLCSNVSSMREFENIPGVISVSPMSIDDIAGVFIKILDRSINLKYLRSKIRAKEIRTMRDFASDLWISL